MIHVTQRLCSAMVLASFGGAVAHAQGMYPQKPLRLVVPFAPGGSNDIVARIVARKFSDSMAQPVIVDNRGGASGIIGTDLVAKAAADGYTLLMMSLTLAVNPSLFKKLPYDTEKDLAPVSLVATAPLMLVVHPSLQAKSLKAFIALAKAHPGKFNFGSGSPGTTPFLLVVHPSVPAKSVSELIQHVKSRPGALRYGSGGSGSPPHLCAEILKSMTGMNIQHIPYKGVTPAMTDTIAGEVQMLISVIPAVLSTVKSGKLRALGVTSAKRTPIVPDLPAIAETVAGYEFIGWYSVFAPAKTPKTIIDKLNGELVKAAQSPDMRSRLATIGVDALGSDVPTLAAYLPQQIAKMADAVKMSGAKVDR